MSLETLLEAAKYVELSTHTKRARGGKPVTLRVIRKPEHDAQAFHPYAKAAPVQEKNSDTRGDTSPDKESDDSQKRRYGGAGTREVHNKLEKNRRAHLKECFDALKAEIPNMEDKKTSNLSILRGALRHIQMLKRKEWEFEQTLQTLAQEKIETQERIGELKRELTQLNIEYDLEQFLKDEETDSDSTATAEGGSPIVSDDEDDENVSKNYKPESRNSVVAKDSVKICQALPILPVMKLNREIRPQLIAPAAPKSIVVTGNTEKKSQNTTSGFIRIIHPEAASPKKPTVAASLAASALAVQQWMAESKTDIKTVSPSILSEAQQIIITTVAAITTTTTTTSAAATITRTPVAQILHQAITQRAALQQQQQQQTQNKLKQEYVVTAAPGLMNATFTTLKPITSLGQIQQTIPMNRINIAPGTSFVAPVSMLAGSTPGATLTNLSKLVAGTATTSAEGTMSFAPINVKSDNVTSGQLKQNTINIPNLATMKQIFATPMTAAQIINPTAAQLGQLMSQAIVRSTLAQVITTSAATTNSLAQIAAPGILTQGGAVPSVINSLGQLTPVTQLLSPMTVVSPAQNLGQTQLGTLTNNSVIKPLTQIPIIQPINLQQVQQQMLKPVVMVPGVLSPANLPTTSPSTVHVTLTNALPVSNSS